MVREHPVQWVLQWTKGMRRTYLDHQLCPMTVTTLGLHRSSCSTHSYLSQEGKGQGTADNLSSAVTLVPHLQRREVQEL